MAHSRADIARIRNAYFAASDASIATTKDLIDVLHGQLIAEENARRAVTMVMGADEAPLELGTQGVKSSIKDLAAKIAGNGQ